MVVSSPWPIYTHPNQIPGYASDHITYHIISHHLLRRPSSVAHWRRIILSHFTDPWIKLYRPAAYVVGNQGRTPSQIDWQDWEPVKHRTGRQQNVQRAAYGVGCGLIPMTTYISLMCQTLMCSATAIYSKPRPLLRTTKVAKARKMRWQQFPPSPITLHLLACLRCLLLLYSVLSIRLFSSIPSILHA